jgi:hypothetical protein
VFFGELGEPFSIGDELSEDAADGISVLKGTPCRWTTWRVFGSGARCSAPQAKKML